MTEPTTTSVYLNAPSQVAEMDGVPFAYRGLGDTTSTSHGVLPPFSWSDGAV
jgi:hypothetical protein